MKIRILLTVITLYLFYIQLNAQTLDRSFVATNGEVNAVAASGDTLYIGGDFTQVGTGRKRLSRFVPGSTKPDLSFPEFNEKNVITAIASDSAGGFY